MRGNGPPAVARLPRSPGVYRFRDAADRVLYVGRASALRSRVASYWLELRGRGHLGPMVARVALVEAVCCDSAHEAAWLERNLLEVSLPPFNRTPGGQETAVYIRLDAGPMHPGLSVAHQAGPAGQVRYFGPYLGGLRVRRTVAALHRILPLPYAGAWLGGAERDLAGRAVPPTATARPSPTRSPRSWNASRPRSAGRTGNWSSCATVPPKPWPMSWRPGSRPRSARCAGSAARNGSPPWTRRT